VDEGNCRILAPDRAVAVRESNEHAYAGGERREARFVAPGQVAEQRGRVGYSCVACFMNTVTLNMYVSTSHTGLYRLNA